MKTFPLLAVCALALSLAACGTSSLQKGQYAAELPAPDLEGRSSPLVVADYRIGPLDKLNISVFQMKDLNLEKVQVDASGIILVPFIGPVTAQGRTTGELTKDISTKLAECCLQSPQVVVTVSEAVSQQITVTGAVVESNVYTLRGPTTLQQAISMAKGPDRQAANLKRVAVWRNANGQRVGALFDLEAIRAGLSPDPQIVAGDTIIVDTSNAKETWRNIMPAIPVLGVFAPF